MNRKKVTKQQQEKPEVALDLQDIIDGIEDDLLVIDSEHLIRFANAAAQKNAGLENEPLVGRLCYQVLHGRDKPCGVPLWDCPLKEVMRSGLPVTAIHPASPPGKDAYLKVTAYPLRNHDGKVEAMVELRRDVTAERELETQILRRHHQLLALSHISSAVSGLRDLDATLKIALESVLELFADTVGGVLLVDEKNKALYYRFYRGLSPKYAEKRKIAFGEGIAGTVARTGETILVEDVSRDLRAARPDLVSAEGVKGFISVPLKSKKKVVGVMNIFSHTQGRFGADDVSLLSSIGDYLGATIEQAKLYDRLARVGERYRVLLQHSLTAQEQERKRIARELHDETAQSLTSLSLSLQALIGIAEMKGYTDETFMEKLQKTHSYAVHAGNEIVRLMKELRPTLLDELGLPAAIHRYAKDSLQAHGINIFVEFAGTDRRFPPEVEVTLFRIAQGAMGNILEHSGARNTWIELKCDNQNCTLTIRDDGKGFNVSKLTKVESSGRGSGLFTMRERTSMLGGSGFVDSVPGEGTRIIASVPLDRTVEDLAEESGDAKDTGTHR
ncbi:GAF domain-containing protein [Chloroflexota bacterium]